MSSNILKFYIIIFVILFIIMYILDPSVQNLKFQEFMKFVKQISKWMVAYIPKAKVI